MNIFYCNYTATYRSMSVSLPSRLESLQHLGKREREHGDCIYFIENCSKLNNAISHTIAKLKSTETRFVTFVAYPSGKIYD